VGRWSQVKDYENVESWVRRVALNFAISRWRRSRRHEQLLEVTSMQDDPAGSDVAVVMALRRLPIKQRSALFLHHIIGLSVEEVANEMSTKSGTGKSWLSRGWAVNRFDLLVGAIDQILRNWPRKPSTRSTHLVSACGEHLYVGGSVGGTTRGTNFPSQFRRCWSQHTRTTWAPVGFRRPSGSASDGQVPKYASTARTRRLSSSDGWRPSRMKIDAVCLATARSVITSC
jgi:hypothetical protein